MPLLPLSSILSTRPRAILASGFSLLCLVVPCDIRAADSSIADAPVVCVSSSTTIIVSGSAKSANRIEEAVYAVRAAAPEVEVLRTVGLVSSYELHPVSARVEIRNAAGRRLVKTMKDFEDIPFVSDGGFVSDTRVLLYRIPPLEPGDTLFTRLEMKEDPFLGFQLKTFADFSVPLLSGAYHVDIPQDLSPRFKSWNGAGDPAEEKRGDRVLWTWTVGPVELPPEESWQPPAADYFPVVSIATSKIAWGPSATWEDVAATYWKQVSDKTKEIPCDLRGRDVRASAGNLERMLDLVQNNVRYLSISLGPGGKVPHSSSEVCRRGYGDCKDMSVLLMSVLSNEGHEGGLALILTRPPAGFKVEPLPTLQYFNHAVVCAEGPNGDVWLDATHPYGTAVTPRPDIQGSPALVVSGPRPGFRHVRLNPPDENLQSTALDLTEAADGSWTGVCRLRLTGSPAVRAAMRLTDAAGRRKFMQHWLAKTGLVEDPEGTRGNALDFESPDFDAVVMTARFPVTKKLRDAAGFILPWDGDPYPLSVLKSRTRITDVYWPELATISDTLRIHTRNPAAAIADTTFSSSAPGFTVTLSQGADDGGRFYIRTIVIEDPVYPATGWSRAREVRMEAVRWSTRSISLAGGGK